MDPPSDRTIPLIREVMLSLLGIRATATIEAIKPIKPDLLSITRTSMVHKKIRMAMNTRVGPVLVCRIKETMDTMPVETRTRVGVLDQTRVDSSDLRSRQDMGPAVLEAVGDHRQIRDRL